MIRLFVFIPLFWTLCCGAPAPTITIIEDEETAIVEPDTIEVPLINKPILSKGVIYGDYNGDQKPFYAFVSRVDLENGITYISFEDDAFKQIKIPKSYGGTLSCFILEGFNRDLLLLAARLKDPNFNKYFLYVLRDGQWKAVMNGFAIHLSNIKNMQEPIRINLKTPNELMRNYSVFSLDGSDPLGYTWLLLEESVPIKNR
jgi:hypothetical protein